MISFTYRTFLLALSLLSSFLLHAQQSPATSATAPPTTKAQPVPAQFTSSANPALWIVKGPHATVYLFGTIHILKPGVEWHTPKVVAATKVSQTLIEEIADIDDAESMKPLIKQLGSDPDHPLSTKITKDDLALLDTAAKQMGAPGENVLEPLRPWLAGITLSVLPMLKAGYDPQSGVDLALSAEFKAEKKPIQGLETVSEQLHLLSDLPPADEIESLHIQLKNLDHATADLESSVTAWQNGDVETIAKIENDTFLKEDPALYQKLVVQRNKAWAEKLVNLLNGDATTFVAVGAAHLAGPDSLQKMLEARGYNVSAQ